MKTLLLTHMPPCKGYSAGLVLDQLCRLLPPEDLSCFAVVDSSLPDAIVSEDLHCQTEYAIKPREAGFSSKYGRVIRVLATYAHERYCRDVVGRRLFNQLRRFVEKVGAERIWCLLESQTLIRLGARAATELGLPFYSQVFDPPAWFLRAKGLDRFSRANVLKDFARAMKASQACATVSQAMSQEYRQKYGIRTQLLQYNFDQSLAQNPQTNFNVDGFFRIGIAGQLYAADAWGSLLESLDKLDWRIEGRQVVIRYMGKSITCRTVRPRWLEFLGWQSSARTIELLSQCDLLYCPYPLAPNMADVSRLSFPSKLPPYLAAGRPILFHGAKDSSPGLFLAEHQAALICSDTSIGNIIGELQRLFVEPELYGQLTRNARQCLETYFTQEVFAKNFKSFLP